MSEKALNRNETKPKTSPVGGGSLRKQVTTPVEEAVEKTTVVNLSRTSKVVKGGKRFSFRALVVVGKGNGEVGVSVGKANQVQLAIQKASLHAKRSMIKFPLKADTIPHEIIGCFGAGKVWMKPAAPGTGVIAGAGVRAVLEAAGVKDVLAKSLGSNNAFNMVYATLEALKQLKNREAVNAARGKAA